MSLSVTLTALPGVPDIQDGDNLSAIFADCLSNADLALRDGDILCVAQKVFSKAEGCIIPLASVTPSPEALRYGEELNKDPRKVEAWVHFGQCGGGSVQFWRGRRRHGAAQRPGRKLRTAAT